MAPPVGSAGFQMVAERYLVDTAILELGRQIYVSDCARCHGVEPIDRYSAQQWRSIMPRMVAETKLTAEHGAAVEAYVRVAHTVLDEGWIPKAKEETNAKQIDRVEKEGHDADLQRIAGD